MGYPEIIAIAWMVGGAALGVFRMIDSHRNRHRRPHHRHHERARAITEIISPLTWATILYLGGFFS